MLRTCKALVPHHGDSGDDDGKKMNELITNYVKNVPVSTSFDKVRVTISRGCTKRCKDGDRVAKQRLLPSVSNAKAVVDEHGAAVPHCVGLESLVRLADACEEKKEEDCQSLVVRIS